MLKLGFLMMLIIALNGCTKSSSSSVSPIQAAGCDIETAILGGAASSIATALTCSDQAAIQTSLSTALGNANLCSTPGVAAVTADQIKQVKSAAVKPQGVIGNLACPIAINTIIGFLSNSVPTAWGCSASSTAASLSSALTAVCEAAVPL